MADVFLMGTSGKFDDPNRSKWREPIKNACARAGITTFDPVVRDWNEQAMQAELDALRNAKVIVMAVTADTAGIASLAESGWAALSAVQRRQAFGIYVDPAFAADGGTAMLSQASFDLMKYMHGKSDAQKQSPERTANELAEASQRARKLVDGHANELMKQFPELNLYVAHSLYDLSAWTVETAKRMSMIPR
jgi:hypothetical protein